MTYQVTKSYGHNLGLSCAFRQWRAKSHCRHIHGYALAFDITWESKYLDENNWVIDFGGLKDLKAKLVETFDHSFVIANDDPKKDQMLDLDLADLARVVIMPSTGCEMFAKHVMDLAREMVTTEGFETRGLQVVSVTCREHDGNSATIVA